MMVYLFLITDTDSDQRYIDSTYERRSDGKHDCYSEFEF